MEALVTKHYGDQVTQMLENNPRLDENLIEVIKNRVFSYGKLSKNGYFTVRLIVRGGRGQGGNPPPGPDLKQM